MKSRTSNIWMNALAIAGFALTTAIAARAEDAPAPRPNLLILLSDDQRWDQVSCADKPIIPELKTPHIDSIASQGVFFRNAFITTPICAVARASIVTGRYASTHGMHHFNTPIAPEVLAKSYPAVLKNHGYRTGVLGKWGMGTEGAKEHFDVFNAWKGQGSYFHETPEGKVHNSEWLARRAHEFLASNPADQPFCLTVLYKAPHHPYQPDPRDADADAFADLAIRKRATDTAKAYERMARHVMEPSLNRWCYDDERKDEATREDFEKNFLRCVLSLDRSVGSILSSLDQLGFSANTVVVFLSDHGYLWGEHGLGGKWLLYEESIRVPFIIHDPRVPASAKGRRLDPMVLNIDLAPTLLDLAGVPIPEEMDGLSLKPALAGGDFETREHFFMEHVGVIAPFRPIPDSLGVRTRDWKYIRYVNVDPQVEELYHLDADPAETRNLIGDKQHHAAAEKMRGIYRSYLNRFQAASPETRKAPERK